MRRAGQGARTRLGALVVRPPAIGDSLTELLGQCAVLLGLEKGYKASRGVIPQQDGVALRHGLLAVSIEMSVATGATALARRWADRRRATLIPWRGGNKSAGRRVAAP